MLVVRLCGVMLRFDGLVVLAVANLCPRAIKLGNIYGRGIISLTKGRIEGPWGST